MSTFCKKLKKNNKGLSPFVWVIVMMMILYLFGFAMDFVRISWMRHTALNEMSLAARVCGRQGGFDDVIPADWDKDAGFPYYTRIQMLNILMPTMKAGGITAWELTFNDNTLYKPPSQLTFNIGTPVNVKMKISYSWPMLSQMLPASSGLQTYELKTKVISEKIIRSGQIIN